MLISTTPTRHSKSSNIVVQSSSDDASSEDETKTESPSKYIESNTSLWELLPKVVDLLDIITTSKQLVRYVKQVSSNSIVEVSLLLFDETVLYRPD